MDPSRLKPIPLFESLSEKERQQVAQWADEVDVGAGKALIEEGQFGWEFFVIESGAAEVRHGGEVIRRLGPGEFFGELALLEDQRRSASVVTSEPTTVIVMTGREFRQMERELPEVAGRIQEAIRQYG